MARGYMGRQVRHPVLLERQDTKHEWQNYAGKTMAIKILYDFNLFGSHASQTTKTKTKMWSMSRVMKGSTECLFHHGCLI
jgi:hypothetical protein